MLLDERFGGLGPEVYGMKDESYRSNLSPERKSSTLQEGEDVNQIVLDFNLEFQSADLTDPSQLKEWTDKAEFVKQFNEEQGNKYLGMIEDKFKQQQGH